MILTIKGFRRISSAQIETAPITLIAGPNEAGKTSCLQAATVALTGQVMPIDGLTKSHAGRLVHSGAGESAIYLETPLGTMTADYPAAVTQSTGEPPVASDYATGIKSLLDLPLKDRSAEVTRLIGSSPTKTDLYDAMEHALGPDSLDIAGRVWATIEKSGWDTAHALARETGTKAKGRWEQVTAERFGSKKSENWRPTSWEGDLETATETGLRVDLAASREWLEAAISSQAVAEYDGVKLRQDIEAGKAAEATVALIRDQIEGLEKTLRTMRDNTRKLTEKTIQTAQPCPHCGKPVAVDNGKLCRGETVSAEKIAEMKKAIDDARQSERAIVDKIDLETRNLATASAMIDAGKRAEGQLAKTTARATENTAGVEDCRARLAKSESRLAALVAKNEAEKLSAEINAQKTISDILAPDGLRLEKLTGALVSFNARLRKITDEAGWASIEVRHDMSISYGTWPYMLLSNGAKKIVRIVLQLAIAIIDRSAAVIIDDTEMLTRLNRNKLMKAIQAAIVPENDGKIPVTVLLAAAIDKREDVPPIGKIGGRAYWVENGKVEAI